MDVNSSDGTNATLISATTTDAGLLTAAKWDEIVANTAKVISDVAYNATSWDGNADAASKNSIRDKIEVMTGFGSWDVSGGVISPTTERKIGVDDVQVLYLPDQTDFQYSIFVGNGGGSLSHSAGVEGHGNTGFGMNAGGAITKGFGSTLIGFSAGSNLTTADYCILTGETVTGNATTDYQLNIGDAITGDIENGNVKITGFQIHSNETSITSTVSTSDPILTKDFNVVSANNVTGDYNTSVILPVSEVGMAITIFNNTIYDIYVRSKTSGQLLTLPVGNCDTFWCYSATSDGYWKKED